MSAKKMCKVPPHPVQSLPAGLDPKRLRLIQELRPKWVNGTTLRYYFFQPGDGRPEWVASNAAQMETVRKAFVRWKSLNIGLDFIEVKHRGDAEIRIGFDLNDGSWSYIGREIRNQPSTDRTMNFGWDIADDLDTALHEIGHTLGFPHEHQNPNAGIEWNETAVYDALARPPNGWDRETTFHNIIRKLDPNSLRGGKWDPDSIMHYPFDAGLIAKPEQYVKGLSPAGDLSKDDIKYTLLFYPPLVDKPKLLAPFHAEPLVLGAGEQQDFVIAPTKTRTYTIQTFGEADTVIVLFEGESSEQRYLAGDDDGGDDRNASLELKLVGGRKYTLRVRCYYAHERGEATVLLT